jgi:radical SAM superfamily enzyme YgiQ (UPF0313 family)
MFSQDWPYAVNIFKKLREKCANSLIIAGGEHISAAPDYSFLVAPEIDICVMGEGESALAELLARYLDDAPFDGIPRTLIRETEKRVNDENAKQRRKNRIKDLSKISWPDWDGFPLENYLEGHHGFGVNLGARTMPILASRGCPYQCTFCSSPTMWTTLWNVREVQDIIGEIKLYKTKYQATNFDFYDLTAIIKKSWIIEFCQALIYEDLSITWQLPSGTRSEAIDDDVVKLLFESGCRNLSYAPESGSPEILKQIKKKIDIDHMLLSMKSCVRSGISVKANVMCGFPNERRRNLLETFRFIIRTAWIGIDDLSINQFSPYPGSELFRDLVSEGKIAMDEEYFRGLSFYSSMTNAVSYSNHFGFITILIYKNTATMAFYLVSMLLHPFRLFRMVGNIVTGKETNRLEKSLLAYLRRRNG